MRKFLLLLLLSVAISLSSPATTACSATGEGNPATALKIWATAITTIYNIFPIKIGGITIATFSGLEDVKTLTDFPVCVCMDPIPRIGIKVSLWEPIAFIETTAIPGCSPSMGFSIPISLYPLSFGANTQGFDNSSYHTFQVHYWKFPVFSVLNLFLDFACLEKGDVDLPWFTEVDPLWQNDIWAAILNPEAILVANPLAQIACMADSVAANSGFPLDFLWWCLGSWGSLYPFTKGHGQGTNITSQMAVSAKMVAKLHRLGYLYGSVGGQGLCGMYPMPIMRKSQYSLLPVHPVSHPIRIPIGRSEFLWGQGKEVPLVNHHVYVNVLYRKRDCCAF